MIDNKNLPKAGCRTLDDEQLQAVIEFYKEGNFNPDTEEPFACGFVVGLCFLGVDESEEQYNQPLDEFISEIYHQLYG